MSETLNPTLKAVSVRKQWLTALCLQTHTKTLLREIRGRHVPEKRLVTDERERYAIIEKYLMQENKNSLFVVVDRVDAQLEYSLKTVQRQYVSYLNDGVAASKQFSSISFESQHHS